MVPNKGNYIPELPLEQVEGAASLDMCKNLVELVSALGAEPESTGGDREELKLEISPYKITVEIVHEGESARGSHDFAEQKTELISEKLVDFEVEEPDLDDMREDFFAQDECKYTLKIEKSLSSKFESLQGIQFKNDQILRTNNQAIVEGAWTETGRTGINREDIWKIAMSLMPGGQLEHTTTDAARLVLDGMLDEFRNMAETNEVMHGMMNTIDRLRKELRLAVEKSSQLIPAPEIDMEEIESKARVVAEADLKLEQGKKLEMYKLYLTLAILLGILSHLGPYVLTPIFSDDDDQLDDDDATTLVDKGEGDSEATPAEVEEGRGFHPAFKAVAENSLEGEFTRVSGNIPNPEDARLFEVRKYKKVIVPAHEIDSADKGSYVGFYSPFHMNFPLGTTLPRSMADFDPAGKDMIVVADNKGNKALYRFDCDPPTGRYATPFGKEYTQWVFVMFNQERAMFYYAKDGEIGGGFKSDLEAMAANPDPQTNISIVTREQFEGGVRVGMPAQTFLAQLKKAN